MKKLLVTLALGCSLNQSVFTNNSDSTNSEQLTAAYADYRTKEFIKEYSQIDNTSKDRLSEALQIGAHASAMLFAGEMAVIFLCGGDIQHYLKNVTKTSFWLGP